MDNIEKLNVSQLFRVCLFKPFEFKISDLSFSDIISLYLRIKIFFVGIFSQKRGLS